MRESAPPPIEPQTLQTVSYTHLDVYKRQVQTLYIMFELHELSIEITYELLIQICFNVWIRGGSADRSRSEIDKPSIRQFDLCAV